MLIKANKAIIKTVPYALVCHQKRIVNAALERNNVIFTTPFPSNGFLAKYGYSIEIVILRVLHDLLKKAKMEEK
jgi:hypothetical protein